MEIAFQKFRPSATSVPVAAILFYLREPLEKFS